MPVDMREIRMKRDTKYLCMPVGISEIRMEEDTKYLCMPVDISEIRMKKDAQFLCISIEMEPLTLTSINEEEGNDPTLFVPMTTEFGIDNSYPKYMLRQVIICWRNQHDRYY